MPKTFATISLSLDGFIAGPDPTPEDPLGLGGEQLHTWALATAAWRESHGREGGETGQDDDVMRETIARTGATVMGRRMYDGGSGPWGDPPSKGWWGDTPPFDGPVFVLTHHPREPWRCFTFVTDGIESAIGQARAAAGDRDVSVSGGASTIQQALAAGLLDELDLHLVPVLLGSGTRLFEDGVSPRLELDRVISSPAVTHLRCRVLDS